MLMVVSDWQCWERNGCGDEVGMEGWMDGSVGNGWCCIGNEKKYIKKNIIMENGED